MYNDEASRNIAHSVAKVADARGCLPAQVAQAWVLNKPEVTSMLVGADTTAQFDSALAALEMQLTPEEVYELERHYTPCDLINDYTSGKRTPRHSRPAKAPFA